jgi:hypothetical protein
MMVWLNLTVRSYAAGEDSTQGLNDLAANDPQPYIDGSKQILVAEQVLRLPSSNVLEETLLIFSGMDKYDIYDQVLLARPLLATDVSPSA